MKANQNLEEKIKRKRKFRVINGGKLPGKKKSVSIRKFLIIIIIFITQYIFLKSDFFLIREIAVTGTKYIPVEQIVEKAEIVNQNIWTLIVNNGMFRIEKKIKTISWIKNVDIRFELPDRMVIDIKERIPLGVIKKENKKFYIDEDGIIFPSVEYLAKEDFPVIKSIEETKILPGNKLKYNNMDKLLKCLKSYNSTLIKEFPEIEIGENKEIILYSKDNIPFKIDPEEDLDKKLSLLPSILTRVKEENLDVKYIDMRYKKYVIKLKGKPENNISLRGKSQ